MEENVVLIMGEISFLDLQNDGEYTAIIHKIDSVFTYETTDEAEESGENMLCDYESYLVPASYNGKIDLTQMEQNI